MAPQSPLPAAADPSDRSINDGPLAHIPLFARLDRAEQEALLAVMKVEQVDGRSTIFWMGDRGGSLYLIRHGEVEVLVPNEKGEHVVLDTLGPGAFFGEISLLDGGPRTATVRTVAPTEVYVLGRSDLRAFIEQRPEVAIDILTVMGQRQRASTDALRGFRNPNVIFARTRVTGWQRVSDVIAEVAASSAFTIFHLVWFGGWIALNLVAAAGWLPERWAFDPFPFGLLTMVVSLEAIFLSIFVMVSQNRQGEKDRLRTELDYQVNVKAQTEIQEIARRLERIESRLMSDAPPGG